MYDLIIIGAGPAGMTAAIYAARRKIKFLMITIDMGGQMSWSSEVENYPGTTSLTGLQLTERFKAHLKDYKIKIKYIYTFFCQFYAKWIFLNTLSPRINEIYPCPDIYFSK